MSKPTSIKIKEFLGIKLSAADLAELEKLSKEEVKMDAQPVSYPVDGGQPVFVDISDDGISDIDANDKVFSDAACTIAYPDGTYKVTGTDFSFTVAAGVVTTVIDPDGAGPNPVTETPDQMAAKKAAELAVPQLAQMSVQMAAQKAEYDKNVIALKKENAELKKAIQLNSKAINEILNTSIHQSAPEKKVVDLNNLSNVQKMKLARGEEI